MLACAKGLELALHLLRRLGKHEGVVVEERVGCDAVQLPAQQEGLVGTPFLDKLLFLAQSQLNECEAVLPALRVPSTVARRPHGRLDRRKRGCACLGKEVGIKHAHEHFERLGELLVTLKVPSNLLKRKHTLLHLLPPCLGRRLGGGGWACCCTLLLPRDRLAHAPQPQPQRVSAHCIVTIAAREHTPLHVRTYDPKDVSPQGRSHKHILRPRLL
mmetsp:Transcript_10853/g.26566  ORF Transcript_10853/g.26566 Transcript_10853/m.26566 type:complete len:215 (-) Transcript_10853:106-750(-)